MAECKSKNVPTQLAVAGWRDEEQLRRTGGRLRVSPAAFMVARLCPRRRTSASGTLASRGVLGALLENGEPLRRVLGCSAEQRRTGVSVNRLGGGAWLGATRAGRGAQADRR